MSPRPIRPQQNPNFAVTEAVARRLGPVLTPVRVTRDVDAIAELASSYAAYAGLGEPLREQGFFEDSSEGALVPLGGG